MKTKAERRRESYAMPKCACGAIAGLGQTQCGRCRDRHADATGLGWFEALAISGREAVDDALRAFRDDATEDAAVALVQAIAKELNK